MTPGTPRRKGLFIAPINRRDPRRRPPAPLPRHRTAFMMSHHARTASQPRPESAPMPAHHKLILLVDDDNEIVESMRTVLENKGYRVLVARDGNAGLSVAERENPDLIVLDMMMP